MGIPFLQGGVQVLFYQAEHFPSNPNVPGTKAKTPSANPMRPLLSRLFTAGVKRKFLDKVVLPRGGRTPSPRRRADCVRPRATSARIRRPLSPFPVPPATPPAESKFLSDVWVILCEIARQPLKRPLSATGLLKTFTWISALGILSLLNATSCAWIVYRIR